MNEPHADSAELGYLGVGQILERFSDGTLDSATLVSTLLERIKKIDGPNSEAELNSIAALASDAAQIADERDTQRRSGVNVGPLHGVPVLIKDNIEAVGLPAAAGSTALWGRPTRDAELVTRLRSAGAIVLGSTNLSQWANIRSPRSTSGWSATGGLVGNPWALDRSAGGSSSGSGAAIAAGLAPLAVGTETDGSIVCPASLNGVVGLKPTVGVVPATRVVPISTSQDSPGPMGRSVDDAARLFSVLSNQPMPATSTSITFAFANNWLSGHRRTDEYVADFVKQLRDSGAVVHDREPAVPGPGEHNDELTVLLSELVDDLGAYLSERPGAGVQSLADVVAYENANAETEMPFFDHELFDMALRSGGRASEQYQDARKRNVAWAVQTCLTPALEDVDVLLAPVYATAWKSDLLVGGHPSVSSCASFAPAVSGWPIMSVPIGLVQGMPVGIALIARANDEFRLLDAGRVVESLVNEMGAMSRPSWRAPSKG